MNKVFNIVIIGLGPRGLAILERINTILPKLSAEYKIKIHLIEKNTLGQGVHISSQPDYLLLNIITSQINFFCDDSVINSGPVSKGPSFLEWVHQFNGGTKPDPNSYLSRATLGLHLNYLAHQFINHLRKHYPVYIHDSYAQDIKQVTSKQYQIYLNNKNIIVADFIFFTTGHSKNKPTKRDLLFQDLCFKYKYRNSKLSYISDIYPIEEIPSKILPASTVAIEGLGLASFDLLTALTIGKNGKYINKNGKLIYVKSGDEPHILMYSLDGLPLSGRAYNQKNKEQRYIPKFFTFEKIDWLRAHKGIGPNKQLDFESDILPLLKLEIYYCYYTTWLRIHFDEKIANEFANKYINFSYSNYLLKKLIDQYIPKNKQMKWKTFFDPLHNKKFKCVDHYKDWLYQFLKLDLTECYKGNIDSPYKASCEIMRDVRDVFRYLIEFSGLTEASHKIFYEKYMPFMNRVSVGPPKERIAEMIALIDAGILNIFIGPSPEINFDHTFYKYSVKSCIFKKNITYYADVIIKARIPSALPEQDESILIQNVLKRGLFKENYNGNFKTGGFAINRDLHPYDQSHKAHQTIWMMGPLVEGAKFFTTVLPSPDINSVVFRDAGGAVLEMCNMIQKDFVFSINHKKDISSNSIENPNNKIIINKNKTFKNKNIF